MKFAPIGHPTTLTALELWNYGYHFALGQELVRDSEYEQFYRRVKLRGGFVIVDNGAAENDREPFSDIVEAAKRIGADEIILPDVLKNGKATLQATCDYPNSLALVPARKRFIVPQGDSWEEWIECLVNIHQRLLGKYITIGLPKHLERLPGGRAHALRVLVANDYHLRYNIHMLGVWQDAYSEILAVRNAFAWSDGLVRGIDSGLPVACAQRGMDLVPGLRRSLQWKPLRYALQARRNIDTMIEWCNR